MALMQVKDLSKSYGVENIFAGVSFQIQAGEKLGLVGPNGAGKTTLLRCLTGEEQADAGEVVLQEKLSYGYLQQLPDYPVGTTLFEVVMESFADLLELRARLKDLELAMGKATPAELDTIMERYSLLSETYERAGGFTCESTVRKISAGLGFKEPDLSREVNTFSGGEKTRAGLARLLTRQPQLLLLDEPTNHLDLNSVEWLEDYLKGYAGALLVISHDRYFLDEVTAKTLELEQRNLSGYPAPYSRYLELKAERVLAQNRAFAKQQKQIQATEEYINKYRAGIKSKQARGRQSQLDRVERLTAQTANETIHLKAGQVDSSGNLVLQLEDLGFGFGARNLFSHLDLQLYKGEKVALLGPNGIGKSSILKLVVGEYQALAGRVRLGARVKLGYYDQEHAGLDQERTVLDEIYYEFDLTEGEARNHLAAFLFQGDDVFKVVKDLSGGEKGRLSFLKLILARPNFLLLDEPTNHLDIPSKQVVEQYLQEFTGTVLLVSHDRYFLDQTVSRIVELSTNGLTDYLGDYTYYKEKKAQKLRETAEAKLETVRNKAQGPITKPKINKAKTRAQVEGLEREIEAMEARLAELSELLASPESYQAEDQARAMVNEYNKLEANIPEHYAEWERLCQLLSSD